jgi:predicted alpha/beta-fold hydrolase
LRGFAAGFAAFERDEKSFARRRSVELHGGTSHVRIRSASTQRRPGVAVVFVHGLSGSQEQQLHSVCPRVMQ